VDQLVNDVINVWQPNYDALAPLSPETKADLADKTIAKTKIGSF